MELKTYLAPLRKWWWLILASTIIAAVTSYIAVSQQPPIYRSHVTLMIGNTVNNPNPDGYEFYLSQQLALTYTDIVQRDVVRRSTQEALGLTWLPGYTAQVVPNTQLMEIAVTDNSPERAMVVANELATQLILQTPTISREEEDASRQDFIRNQLNDLELKIQETNDEIVAKQEELAGLFSARQIADAQTQIAALNNKLNTLQSNYANLLASSSAGAVNRLTVIEPATIPQYPVGPEVMMTVLTAAAIGFSLAVGAAYLLEYLDDTIKTPDDVEAIVKLPTLSGIAEYKPEGGQPYQLVTLKQPRSPISEAYRSLRTAVLFTNVDKQIRTMLVTSSGPAEGKSLTAANLGVVMAQAGHRVLIVDADLRRPMQHRIFEVARSNGMTNLLVDIPPKLEQSKLMELFVQINKSVVETAQPGLLILPSGPIPPNPAEVVGSGKMKMLLDLLATRFDYVIIDSPPVLAVTDAVIIGTRVDSVLLIASSGDTRGNQLKQAVQRLREVNANIAGVVLNRLTASSGDYYYYYYYQKSYYRDESGGDQDDGGSGGVTTTHEKRRRSRDHEVRRGRLLPEFFARLLG